MTPIRKLGGWKAGKLESKKLRSGDVVKVEEMTLERRLSSMSFKPLAVSRPVSP